MNKLISFSRTDHNMAEVELKKVMGDNFFGSDKWRSLFDLHIAPAPEIPAYINKELLLEACQFNPNKKIYETHSLYLSPLIIDKPPLSIWAWRRMHKSLNNKTHFPTTLLKVGSFGSKKLKEIHRTQESHWVLLYNGVIPEATEKKYLEQEQLLMTYPHYERINALDLATGIILQKLATGAQLFDIYEQANEWYKDHYVRTDSIVYQEDRLCIGSLEGVVMLTFDHQSYCSGPGERYSCAVVRKC